MADLLEEAHLLEQIGEAVGVEDDRHQVGLVALVIGDQIRCERPGRHLKAGFELGQAIAGLEQRGLNVAQLGLTGRELLLERRQPHLGRLDAPGGLADLSFVGRDRLAQRGRRRPAGVDLALKIA